MTDRQHISSGGPWEAAAGYSRAVRVGPHIWVAGTTAMTPEGLVGVGDAHAQALQAFRTIGDALAQAGATLQHVVRTRLYVVDLADVDAVGRAHREMVGDALPAATLVKVAGLVHPDMRIEVEVDAYVPA